MDAKILETKPWAQDLTTQVLNISKKYTINWCNIICRIGEAEIDIEEYMSIFLHHVETLFQEMVADVETIKEKSLNKIERLLQQMQNLCRDLHTNIPEFNYENVPLCELQRTINRKVEEFESLAESRRKELNDLLKKQLTLCQSLGKAPMIVVESPLPLPKEVDALKMYIEGLENDAMEREETYFKLKEEIMEIVSELGTNPKLDFEKEILNLTDTEVRISDNDMKQLKEFKDRMTKQLESVKEEITELRIKVDELWNKLETDIGERDCFRQKTKGNSLDTLNLLKEEVNRLEEIKKANIKVFINKQREELKELWEKCHTTHSERSEFTFFFSECYNEDLFELHEREIDKWRTFYSDNKEIFSLLQEHKKLWNEHLKLELNSGGANRYKNRGGQLLIEEKLRNKFKKRIPKIEETLIKLSEAYFAHKGKQFTTFGQTIEDYISKLHADEEQEFKIKLSAKKQQREQVSTMTGSKMNFLTPCSFNPTLTPRQCSKRKIIATPVTEPAKKFKPITHKKVPKTGLPKLNISASRNKRRSARREQLRHRLSFKSNKNEDKENQNETISTSYNEFAKDVSKKNNCRSTEFVLKELNVPVLQTESDTFMQGIGQLPKTPLAKRHK